MAGVELGEAYVLIRAEQGKLKADIEGIRGSTAAAFGAIAGIASKAATAAMDAVGGALHSVSTGALKAASDANESLSKVGVVFGENAGVIEAWAATAASSFGQSRSEALAASGTLGNLFVAMGVGSKEATGLSMEMVELAGDLGSFNNIASSDALEKLRAGLIGEAEPLRALGVNMNAAMVEAKGMELGLADANGELSEAAKVQARYAIIMEQTKTAQGDFSRTSTGMANATKIIQSSFADLQVQIGDQLLPIIAPLISSFAQWLPGAIEASKPVLVEVGKVFGEVSAAVGVVFEWIGKMMAGWQATSASVSEETSALWRIIEPVFAALERNLALFFEEVFPELKKTWAVVVENIQAVTRGFAIMWNEHWATIEKVLTVVMTVIEVLIDTTFGALSAIIKIALAAIRGDWEGVWNGIKEYYGIVWDGIKRIVLAVLPLIQEALLHVWGTIQSEFVQTWENIKTTFNNALETLKTAFRNAGPALIALLKAGIDSAWGGLVGGLQANLNRLAGLLPHSLAEWGPLSEPTDWTEVVIGNLPEVLGEVVTTVQTELGKVGSAFTAVAASARVATKDFEMTMELGSKFRTEFDASNFPRQRTHLTLDQAMAGDTPAATLDAPFDWATSNFNQNVHAAHLAHAGANAASATAPGVQLAQVIELDGVAVGRAVAPYVGPEITHWGGSRVRGV